MLSQVLPLSIRVMRECTDRHRISSSPLLSTRSTLTAVFEWLDISAHPNARLEYGAVAVLARKEWLQDEDVAYSPDPRHKPVEGETEEVHLQSPILPHPTHSSSHLHTHTHTHIHTHIHIHTHTHSHFTLTIV